MNPISVSDFRKFIAKKPSKYRNKKCEMDGHKFDSQKEMKRYQVLKEELKRGEIKNLFLQVEYELTKGIKYRSDFVYFRGPKLIVEDVKGFKTPVYRIKKILMKNLHGIDILET